MQGLHFSDSAQTTKPNDSMFGGPNIPIQSCDAQKSALRKPSEAFLASSWTLSTWNSSRSLDNIVEQGPERQQADRGPAD